MSRNLQQSPMQGLSIFPATNQDKIKVVALVSSILAEYGFECDFSTSESDLLDIEETYFNSGGTFQLVEDVKENLIGTYAILPITKETCKLRKMYLIPQARGHGVGRYMMQQVIETAKVLGFKYVILETSSVMKDAIKLYVQSGFQEIAQPAQSPRCDHVFILHLTQSG